MKKLAEYILPLKKDNEESKIIFEMMFEGLLIWGFVRKEKGVIILARESHSLLRLEEISKECDCGRIVVNDEKARELNVDIDFKMTEKDIDFYEEYIGNVNWAAGKPGRKALKVLEILKRVRSNEYAID